MTTGQPSRDTVVMVRGCYFMGVVVVVVILLHLDAPFGCSYPSILEEVQFYCLAYDLQANC